MQMATENEFEILITENLYGRYRKWGGNVNKPTGQSGINGVEESLV